MPEGPEVKTITDRLHRVLQGKTVSNLRIHTREYAAKQMRNEFNEFRQALPLTVDSVNCKGKFIYWKFSDEWVVFNTLGMSGTWRFGNLKSLKGVHFTLEFSDGTQAHYRDTRRFGTFKFFQTNSEAELQTKLSKIGPDMLSESVSDEFFIERLRKKNHWNICKAIMNQQVVSGVGNYIKAEALYKARINPHAKVEDLSDDNLKDLNKQIKSVIYSSFANRGATFRDYVMPDGDVGTYAFQFEVYSKSSDPYMNRVVREETPDKRTTHWVPEIQTIGRITELVETPLTAQSALV
jgi:formamidopyrimidine-DNA glycosylase